jgi:hypothetical protein
VEIGFLLYLEYYVVVEHHYLQYYLLYYRGKEMMDIENKQKDKIHRHLGSYTYKRNNKGEEMKWVRIG